MSFRVRQIIISNLILLVSILGSVAFIYYWDSIKDTVHYGYIFVFLTSFIAGSPIPVLDPYYVVVFSMASVLSPLLVAIVSGLGIATGQTIAFLLGRLGRHSLLWGYSADTEKSRAPHWTEKTIKWAQKRGSIAVFFLSALFNPVFTPIAIAMGALQFQVMKFFILCLAGNTLKSLFIAYLGYFGLGILLRQLGVNI
jgi:membrane protein YqaA with SNARE-associated domain